MKTVDFFCDSNRMLYVSQCYFYKQKIILKKIGDTKMKARKFVTGVAVLAFSAMILGACGSDESTSTSSSSTTVESSTTSSSATTESSATIVEGAPLQDGTYTLEEQNYSNGYRVVFSITVADGKITESNYDNVNEAGDSKADDTEYNESMNEVSGTDPEAFIPALNESLVATQSAGDVEVVTGATHSSQTFQNYAQQLIQAAQAGNEETIMIDNGAELQDGTYTLEEMNYYNGYRTTFSITVEGGVVTESNYDNVNEAGESKTADTEYNESMNEVSGTDPETFIPALNEALVAALAEEDGTAADVEVITGATHSTHSFIMYAEQLINAAEKGDTTPIEIDNIITE